MNCPYCCRSCRIVEKPEGTYTTLLINDNCDGCIITYYLDADGTPLIINRSIRDTDKNFNEIVKK